MPSGMIVIKNDKTLFPTISHDKIMYNVLEM